MCSAEQWIIGQVNGWFGMVRTADVGGDAQIDGKVKYPANYGTVRESPLGCWLLAPAASLLPFRTPAVQQCIAVLTSEHLGKRDGSAKRRNLHLLRLRIQLG